MEIKRDLYLDRIKVRCHNGLIKVITGIRRCGKSYLLNNIFYNFLINNGIQEDHIIQIAFDIRSSREWRDPEKLCEYINSRMTDRKMYYLLLDEVQMLDDFSSVLNEYLRRPNADIYVTGSNSRFLSTDVLTELRGRGDEIHIYPLSFSEYASAFEGNINDQWQEYITYGGLPLTVNMETDEQKSSYLSHLFIETYLKDILERNRIKNDDELSELINILASDIGSLTNPYKLSNTFKSVKKINISPVTLSKYVKYLEEAFIINEAKRYDVKGKKYIDTPFKYYFEDIGLRNARLDFRQVEENHIMENIIYNELRLRGYKVDVGVVSAKEKTQDADYVKKQFEVDFVANQGNKRYYVQSAYQLNNDEKTEQEKRSFKKIEDSFKKIIVIKDNIKLRRDENGFVTIGIWDFLLNPNSLDL